MFAATIALAVSCYCTVTDTVAVPLPYSSPSLTQVPHLLSHPLFLVLLHPRREDVDEHVLQHHHDFIHLGDKRVTAVIRQRQYWAV